MGLAEFAAVKNRDSKNFPGPGQYNAGNTMGKVRLEHVTFKGRYKSSSATRTTGQGTNDSVGPGKYDVDLGIGGPKFSIGQPQNARMTKAIDTLGPAYSPRQYQIGNADPHGPNFTFKGKVNGSGAYQIITPGPDYDLPTSLTSKGTKFARPNESNRKVIDHNDDNGADANGPGPSRYDVPRFGDIVPASKTIPVHYSKKQRSTDNEIGPGEYDVNQYTIGKKTTPRDPVGCTFGGRKYPPLPAPCGEPGPAAYELSQNPANKAKGKTLGRKFESSGDLDKIYPKPGPGDYDMPSEFNGGQPGAASGSKTKGFSFGEKLPLPGQSPRIHQAGNGPYDLPPEIPQFSMSAQVLNGDIKGARFSPRNQIFDKQQIEQEIKENKKKIMVDTPGPASYNPKASTSTGPSYSLTAREHNKGSHLVDSATSVPGPGTYNAHQQTREIKGFTFYKGSFADAVGNQNPGPGSYEDKDAFNQTKSARGAGFSLHTPAPPPKGSIRRQ